MRSGDTFFTLIEAARGMRWRWDAAENAALELALMVRYSSTPH
jgi:hypothetical protein